MPAEYESARKINKIILLFLFFYGIILKTQIYINLNKGELFMSDDIIEVEQPVYMTREEMGQNYWNKCVLLTNKVLRAE